MQPQLNTDSIASFDRVVIVGVGLLGGSIGLALRERRIANKVVGVGRSDVSREKAVACGAVESCVGELGAAFDLLPDGEADLVVICTPVMRIAEFAKASAPRVAVGGLITDVGSTKANIATELSNTPQFVGSHPLAGSDRSGPEFADAHLFEGRTVVVTPSEGETSQERGNEVVIGLAESFWTALGGITLRMTAAEHDRAVALTSHLPHLLAANLARETPESLLPLVASGWMDTTRIAGGNVEMWLQIIEDNRQPILQAINGYSDSLKLWSEAIESEDRTKIEELLKAGKHIRDSVGN
ncbi:MAG: prephenate dehydrogenase [Pirellulaceae bacterium]